jgi:hypothetical protein
VIAEPLSVRRLLLEKRVLPNYRSHPLFGRVDHRPLQPIASVRRRTWKISSPSDGTTHTNWACALEHGKRCASTRVRDSHCRIHSKRQEFRCADHLILRERRAAICGAHEKPLYAGNPRRSGDTPSSAAGCRMSVRQSSGKEKRTVGPGFIGCQNEGMPMTEGCSCRSIEFARWPADLHLRHTSFIALRHDKNARCVTREKL